MRLAFAVYPLRKLVLAAAVGLTVALPRDAASLELVPSFGDNPGQLDMFVHVPAGNPGGLPLVVALHGCMQQATDFDDETGLLTLANATPFVLLLPQQRITNNRGRCFNWFRTQDNRPQQGESASIRNMIDAAIARYSADPNQVYVLGLSAGGGMTVVLVANYPRRFAGAAVMAGTPFDCNRPYGFAAGWWLWLNMVLGDAESAAYSCGLLGNTTTDRSAADWGEFVRDEGGAPPTQWPPMSLWQGGADGIVDPANQRELVEQWTNLHGIDAVPDSSDTMGAIVRQVFQDSEGAVRVETWRIAGFPHAVPIDPGQGPEACGVAADFVVDADICAVRRIAAFWGLIP